MSLTTRRRAELLLVAITVIWGSTFVVTKSILAEGSPHWYSGIRFLSAALIMLILFYRRCTRFSRPALIHGCVLGSLLYVGFILQTIGIMYTTASKAAFFTGMLVPFTPLVQFAAQRLLRAPKRPLKLGNVFGVLCAAGGLYLLTSPAGSGFNVGDALNLSSALFFAGFIVYLDTVPAGVDKTELTFIQFSVCGIVGVAVAMLVEDYRLCTSTGCIMGLAYLTVFATVITMWMQNRYQGETTPTRAAVIFAIEPVVAAVFAYVIRGEIIGVPGMIGGAIVIAGLFLSEFSDEIAVLRMPLA